MRVLSKQEIKDLNIQLTEDCQLVEKIPHNQFVMESLLLCIASRKLYNTGLYHFRQQYIKNGTCLTYETLAKQLKHNSHFQSLPAKVSQQTLKMLSQDIKSFFALKQSDKLTEEEKRRIKLPQYKQYFSPVIYTQQALYKQTYTKKGLIHLSGTDIQFKSNLDFNQICQVRIIPLKKNKIKSFESFESFMLSEHDFRIEVVYNADLTKLKNNTAVKLHKKLIKNISSKGKEYIKEEIDSIKINTQAQHFIGIDQNLDGIVTSDSHAYSLKPVKSVNHYWNKSVSILKSEIASIEAILSNSEKKQILTDYSTDCLKNTIHKLRSKIRKITRYRNNFVENYVHQLSNQFINQLSEKVQLIIYGKNVNFKKEINLGKITNQNFVQIPFNKIIEKISYKAALKGIHFMTVEESYTSKTSFIDKEELFNYKNNKPNKNYHFVGKRITRGAFKTMKGHVIHADVNAACNIARKVIGEEIYHKIDLRSIMGSSLKKVKIKL